MIMTGLVVGLLLGIVMQRGRFCVTGMLRDIFLQNSWRTFTALLVVIAVHAVGLTALMGTGTISPEFPTFAPAAVVLGSLLFGLGIVLAGGCASGTWYRSAEGLVGSWLALLMYAISAAAMKKGALGGVTTWMKSWDTGLTTIPSAFGLSPWIFVFVVVAVAAAMVAHFLRREALTSRPAALTGRPWWKRPLHLYVAAVLVGLLGVLAWPLSAATGRNDGLGITSPSSNLVKYVVTGNDKNFDWGVLLVVGLFLGAFVAARATGEFRVRVPDAKTAGRAVVGGLMMGVGASLTSGCTVGNGMVQTSLFTFQGWVSLVFIALGVGLGARLWLKPRSAESADRRGSDLYDTEASIENPAMTSAGDRSELFVASVSQEGVPSASTAFGDQPSGAFSAFASAPGAVALKERRRVASDKVTDLGNGYFALDSLGDVCPFPLIEAKDVMKDLETGDHLVIDFDCTQATQAIPQWAAEDGHEVTDFRELGDASWQIALRKG